MSRTQESGAYLGGIGAMLGEADGCPLCGEVHPEPRFGIRHGRPRECPKVVLGSFPVLDQLPEEDGTEFPRVPAARRIREFETPLQVSFVASPPSETDVRPRGLGVPWLRPPELGGII